MKNNQSFLGFWIRPFLTEYLITIKNYSINTVRSYRDSLSMFLIFIKDSTKKRMEQIRLEDITPTLVEKFLKSIEEQRKCSVSTRNQRLAAIHSLAQFIASKCPEQVEWSRMVHTVPPKKKARSLITYLEKEEMNVLLNAPNKKSIQGRKDYALLLFLYNSGARASEVCNLLIKDLSLPRIQTSMAMATICGKGNKTRRCPLWNSTTTELKRLIENRSENEHVFLNRYGNPLTRFGVFEMIDRVVNIASKKYPKLKEKKISPHVIRHTTASHLLQAGVDINTIRVWLGHTSVETTNIYAEVNMEMKSKALKECEISTLSKDESKSDWKNDEELMSFLKKL